MPEHDVISQGELAALMNDLAEWHKTGKALEDRRGEILARVRRRAAVEPGPYRVVQARMFGRVGDMQIVDGTWQPRPGYDFIVLGTAKAKKGA